MEEVEEIKNEKKNNRIETGYIYQARIMREQLHASSWPYLEWLLIFNEETGLKLELTNNGVGPALIKDVRMKLNGKEIMPDSLFFELLGTDLFPYVTSKTENRVLSAQNSIRPFQVTNTEWANKIYIMLDSNDFEFQVCYESIYGDKWTTTGTTVTKSMHCSK